MTIFRLYDMPERESRANAFPPQFDDRKDP